MDMSKMTKVELVALCKQRGITRYSSKTKAELISLLQDQVIHQPTPSDSHTFIEVCAGGGGLSCGLIKAGFHPLLLNDSNKDCCQTLRLNHPRAHVVHGKMEDIDFTPYVNNVTVLAGGVPCQSFSQAGSRRGLDDDRGMLFFKFIDIVALVRPTVFLLENVKGLLTHDKGNTFLRILQELEALGDYNITHACLNACNYNVPQKRERVFIVGVRNTLLSTFNFPPVSKHQPVLRDVLHNVPVSDGAVYPDNKIKLFKMIPPGGCWVNLPVELQKEYLGNSYYSGGGKRGILYRLDMDKPCLTLLCTPSQKQTERCHPIEDRPLTVREYARIQTFDDDYNFVGSLSSQYRQIGNAVPVELARQIAMCIRDMLTQNQ